MERYENPCTPERCDVSHCCSKGTDAMPQTWEYWRTCTTYALYLGHQEGYAAGQSELTALRAEVEVMRRAVDRLAGMVDCHDCPFGAHGSERCVTNTCAALTEWAISEARKG